MVVLMHAMPIIRCLSIALLLVSSGGVPASMHERQAERRTIKVSAERFAFTPSRIELTAGEEVEIKLRSDDTSHGFRIVGLDTNIAIPKRGKGEATVVVKIDKPGTYRFECNRVCGAGHNFMSGEIVVRERTGAPATLPSQISERR
jgi:heme/copper-type cytochrome/quinol oxidase subunit 2